jgi:aldose 1-epimerase
VWEASGIFEQKGAQSIELKYYSIDGEENYPGNVKAAITYSLEQDEVLLFHLFT